MANLIIKPTSGGSLILQDEGGDAALTVGTTGSTTLAGTANNVGTVTGGTYNSTIGSSATMPAGVVVQTTTPASAGTETSITVGTNNVWQDTVVTSSITPKYNNSKIVIFVNYGANLTNSSSDGGFGTRFKRAISGGATSYPASASIQEGTSNAHSTYYEGTAPTSGNKFYNHQHVLFDAPATTSAVTYTMQVATYNMEALNIAGSYTSYWHIFFMEIKV